MIYFGAGESFDSAEYWIGTPGEERNISNQELDDLLLNNIELTEQHYGDFLMRCFWSHIKAEFSVTLTSRLRGDLRDDPYEVIEFYRTLANRKTFKGKCDICKVWD